MSPFRRIASAGLLLLAAACSGPTAPTKFYTLAPKVDETAAERQRERTLVIGVGPVGVPEYLKRPQIVTRTSATQMRLGDFDQWVEPFDILFPRVLAQDLSALLGSNRVNLTPMPREIRVDNLVEVDVIRFDADGDESVTLDALWRVYGRDGDRLVDQGRATVTRSIATAAGDQDDGGIDFPAIVATMSDVTTDLATAIAAAIDPKLAPPVARSKPTS